MSGHSHFSTIKHKKATSDAKKSQIFSKLARFILIAAKEKGGNVETNSGVKAAIDKAKEMNMPKDNIERAIKKGTGELSSEALENITIEAYGPGGIAIIVEGITDNKNRSLSEIRLTLSQHNGKLVGRGGVSWMFERKEGNWIPKQEVEASEKNRASCQKLFEALDENDSVQDIYCNLKD